MYKYLSHALAGTAIALVCGGRMVFAAAGVYDNPITYGGIDTIPGFLSALVDLIFLIGTPIIVIFIIYAGFLFVTAGGNEAQLAKARTTIKWTLLGALVLLGAKAIASAVQATIDSL